MMKVAPHHHIADHCRAGIPRANDVGHVDQPHPGLSALRIDERILARYRSERNRAFAVACQASHRVITPTRRVRYRYDLNPARFNFPPQVNYSYTDRWALLSFVCVSANGVHVGVQHEVRLLSRDDLSHTLSPVETGRVGFATPA